MLNNCTVLEVERIQIFLSVKFCLYVWLYSLVAANVWEFTEFKNTENIILDFRLMTTFVHLFTLYSLVAVGARGGGGDGGEEWGGEEEEEKEDQEQQKTERKYK